MKNAEETRAYLNRRIARAEEALNDAMLNFQHTAMTYDPRSSFAGLVETIAGYAARVDTARGELKSLRDQLDLLDSLEG